MIVKILSSSASFSGVRYNTNKMDNGKGELMAVRNFGILQGLSGLRPEDYRNYLKMISGTNKAVKQPQFHAAISAEGRSYDKNELTEIAIQWLEKMGYAEQPYLIVFHRDTANNHVHVITTRINRQGRKINSGFENIRAVQNLNTVVGIGEKNNAQKDLEKALAYSFSTKAQFMMILESQGYKLAEKEGALLLIKFGKVQADLTLSAITDKLKRVSADDNRKKQVAALLHKYAHQYGMTELADYLKQKHGIVLLFHAKESKKAYGYTIIDHAGKAVYKGGDILSLSALRELAETEDIKSKKQNGGDRYKESIPGQFRRDYYKAMLTAAIRNFPDIRQGLRATDIGIYFRDDRYYLIDHADKAFIPLEQLLTAKEHEAVIGAFAQSGELSSEVTRQHIGVPSPAISADVDDEAIYGRNRKRGKPLRTNNR